MVLTVCAFSLKHDAIIEQGIPIIERVPIPDEMIPDDSRVEIDAKIHSGCVSSPRLRRSARCIDEQPLTKT